MGVPATGKGMGRVGIHEPASKWVRPPYPRVDPYHIAYEVPMLC